MNAQTHLIEHTKATEMAAIYARNTVKIVEHLHAIDMLRDELKDVFFECGSFDFTIEASRLGSEYAMEDLQREFKRDGWKMLVEKLEIHKYLSSKKREEFTNCFHGKHRRDSDPINDFPEITEESIHDVLMGYVMAAPNFLDESIREEWEFWKPQRDQYKTNKEKWKVSSKVIRGYMVSRGYFPDKNSKFRAEYSNEKHLQNLDNIFHLLDGKGFASGHRGPLVSEITGCDGSGETDYFKFKCFNNGNLHLWFKRQDLLDKFNEIGCGEGTSLPNPTDGDTGVEICVLDGKPPASTSLDFFESTPIALDELMQHVEISEETKALEPSAGEGAIAYRLLNEGCHDVTCIEINPTMATKLQSRWNFDVSCMDFLSADPVPTYDLVAMNPPFSKFRDMYHVYHAYKFLARGGRLVAIMSPHWKFADNKHANAFRTWVHKLGFEWHDLPEGTFKESGTMVNAGILVLNRPEPDQNPQIGKLNCQ